MYSVAMSSLGYILCCVCLSIFINTGCDAAEQQCGPNKLIDPCPRNCSYDYCPKDELQDKSPCPKPVTCPPPACKCGFNYRLAENDTCIPTEECPPFDCPRENEMYDPCPSYCPGDDCRNANPTGECPFLSLLVVTCSPACRCKPNYWRNDGICVPYLQCRIIALATTLAGFEFGDLPCLPDYRELSGMQVSSDVPFTVTAAGVEEELKENEDKGIGFPNYFLK